MLCQAFPPVFMVIAILLYSDGNVLLAQSNEPAHLRQLPAWLTTEARETEALEQQRSLLRKHVSVDFRAEPLKLVVKELARMMQSKIYLTTPELDLVGVDPAMPITFAGEGTVSSILPLILDPLELDFKVHPAVVEITSKDAVQADPTYRYYDVLWVLESMDDSAALVATIEASIDPDSWIATGGTSSIHLVGPTLVVTAPAATQRKIESLFANLLRIRELRRSTKP